MDGAEVSSVHPLLDLDASFKNLNSAHIFILYISHVFAYFFHFRVVHNVMHNMPTIMYGNWKPITTSNGEYNSGKRQILLDSRHLIK